MVDQFKVPRAHIEAHAKLLEEQKKFKKTDSTENKNNTRKVPRAHIEAHAKLIQEQRNLRAGKTNNVFKVPRAHIEAHAKLLQEQHKWREIMIELDFIKDINKQQEELEGQIKSLQQESQDKEKTSKEIKFMK